VDAYSYSESLFNSLSSVHESLKPSGYSPIERNLIGFSKFEAQKSLSSPKILPEGKVHL